jgi:hypothetical protein
MSNPILIRAGNEARLFLLRRENAETREILRECTKGEVIKREGSFRFSWQHADAIVSQLETLGISVEVHGGPRTEREKDDRLTLLWERAQEKIATLPQPMDKYTEEKMAGILWLLSDGNKLLADDCGFGKAVQAIIAASVLEENK